MSVILSGWVMIYLVIGYRRYSFIAQRYTLFLILPSSAPRIVYFADSAPEAYLSCTTTKGNGHRDGYPGGQNLCLNCQERYRNILVQRRVPSL